MWPCNDTFVGGNNYWTCHREYCDVSGDDVFQILPGKIVTNQALLAVVSSSAAAAPETSTTSATTNPVCPSIVQTRTTMGLGVGLGLGFPLLFASGAALFLWHKLRGRKRAYVNEFKKAQAWLPEHKSPPWMAAPHSGASELEADSPETAAQTRLRQILSPQRSGCLHDMATSSRT